jgi:hypothetical protein
MCNVCPVIAQKAYVARKNSVLNEGEVKTLMVRNELLRCHSSDRAVCPLLVIFLPPRFDDELRFLQRYKPVSIETLIPELAIKAFDEGVMHRFARLNKVQVHAMLRRPGIQGRAGDSGPLSKIRRSGSGRVRNSRSRIRHTRAPPMELRLSRGRRRASAFDFNHRHLFGARIGHRQTLVASSRHQPVMH